ncbi:unnamed protein product, partial [Ectocarpus sp. 12 AP-2014]
SCHDGGGYVAGLGNGYCNEANNIEECDYDAGDCCQCTCGIESDGLSDFSCLDFACVDPNAPCVDDDVTEGMFEDCFNFGDGFCNDYNNNEQCGYDGGDCCECTCVVDWSAEFGCTEFACIDPTAPCVDDDDVTADALENCMIEYLGDGYCDTYNNIEICDYDGGDCCECTCGSDSTDVLDGSDCWDFVCIDPTASCFDESITVDMYEYCDVELLGDSMCQPSNNFEVCDYDFGDCCEATCGVDSSGTLDELSCSSFACVDPRFVTPSPTPAPLSSECLDDPACVDSTRGQSVDDPG